MIHSSLSRPPFHSYLHLILPHRHVIPKSQVSSSQHLKSPASASILRGRFFTLQFFLFFYSLQSWFQHLTHVSAQLSTSPHLRFSAPHLAPPSCCKSAGMWLGTGTGTGSGSSSGTKEKERKGRKRKEWMKLRYRRVSDSAIIDFFFYIIEIFFLAAAKLGFGCTLIDISKGESSHSYLLCRRRGEE